MKAEALFALPCIFSGWIRRLGRVKALTVLLSVVPGIGCYLGLIDGRFGVIEAVKTPLVL